MGINPKYEAILVVILYLTTVYFWTIPLRQNPMPYGEVDAASHYAVAEFTIWQGRSITLLPYYIDVRYGDDNKFKNHVLWYPPPFHTNLAIASALGGETDKPIYLANAVFSSLAVLTVYFLLRKLYGFLPALISLLLLSFSLRDIMVYLWGQWPERMGFAFVPLVLYCFYQYYQSYKGGKEKFIYLYLLAGMLAINLYIHPMTFFHSTGALVLLAAFFSFREKRFFFVGKHFSFSVLVFILMISIFPFQTANVLLRAETDAEAGSKGDYSRLLQWFKPEDNPGVPPIYFSYKDMIGPAWTIPFIIAGAIALIARRKPRDLVMLAWLISLYIMLHLDVIGRGRVHRSLSGTAHIFYPLMAIGLLFIVSYIPLHKSYRAYLKYGASLLFIIFLGSSLIPPAVSTLTNSYQGITRINNEQYAFAQWLKSSDVPEDAKIFHLGSISLAKTRWLSMTGHRYLMYDAQNNFQGKNATFMVIDASDFALMNNNRAIEQLGAVEAQLFANKTSIYKQNNIGMYALEP
ncbi:glycosyltransferase family 39 protein [Candidatus Woesearchaeota archaeon]|nr:glycosyltransferase family 39 protein [Candidatus Woesearchaeota archaeon]